jgi:Flp pilus assembly protein TadG
VLRISRLEPSRRRDDGTSAVEFALVLIPLVTLVFGIVQYGLYFYSSQVGASTAREAARRLAVGDCDTAGALRSFIENRLGSASTASPSIATSYKTSLGSPIPSGDPVEIGGTVTVTITFQSVDMNFPFIPVPDGAQITRAVDARVEDDQSSGCA